MVVAGPCSIHDTKAAREYADLLKGAIEEFSAELRIVMRVYFEKPRTTIGWKGLINDPHLDQSFKINDGLRLARHLLLDLAEMGVPAGTEFLDMISPQYIAGLVSWGAIGARTTESQVHRQLISGLSCPVGFKNGTSGNVHIAIDALLSAAHPHTFLGHTKHGQSAIFCHRGQSGLSHHPARRPGDWRTTPLKRWRRPRRRCSKAGLAAAHHDRLQPRQQQQGPHAPGLVCRDVAAQIAAGRSRIIGVMIESNLVAGAQTLVPGKPLVYGQSITDACIDWSETHGLLKELATAVRSAGR